jgi:hypothetical protein
MAAKKTAVKPKDAELIAALGADEVTYHAGGVRLLMGGKTAAYCAETRRGLRLRVIAGSLPAALTRGLEVVPIPSRGQLTVHVPREKAARVRPILEHVAARAKP